jgi:hypothetical protein
MISRRTDALVALMLVPLILAGGLQPAKAVTRGAVCNELARSCLRECANADTEYAYSQCQITCYSARDACNAGNGNTSRKNPAGPPGSPPKHGIGGVSPPPNAGTNKGPSGGGSATTIEKH